MTATAPTSSSSSPSDQDLLKATTFQRLHPRAYFERFLAENVRPDGRAFDDWRAVSVNVGSISTANGSALVRLGETTIVCGVKAEIAEPALDTPGDGFLVPNIDLGAICSPRFKPGPPTEEAQVLSDRLRDALVDSSILPLSSLCIHPAKAAWVLYIDATCINYDGNAFDAALLAMVAALQNTRLPKATYNEETSLTTCSPTTSLPLCLNTPAATLPLSSFSFGTFDSTHLLSDATSFEEPLLDGTVSVLLDGGGEVVSVSQLGVVGVGGEGDVLERCVGVATRRREEVERVLMSALAEV